MASVLDRLREQRETQLAEKRLSLPVKGWDGLLYVRYRPLSWEKLMDLLDSVALDAESGVQANADALVAACDALLVKDDPEGEPRSLAAVLREQGEDVPQAEVRFDEVACDALGIEGVQTARETVLAIFAGAVSPELSVAEHAARLGGWMRSAAEEVDDSLLGG